MANPSFLVSLWTVCCWFARRSPEVRSTLLPVSNTAPPLHQNPNPLLPPLPVTAPRNNVGNPQLEVHSTALLLMTVAFGAGMNLLALQFGGGSSSSPSGERASAMFILFAGGIAIVFWASLVALLIIKLGLPKKAAEAFLWVSMTGLVFSFLLLLVLLLSQPWA